MLRAYRIPDYCVPPIETLLPCCWSGSIEKLEKCLVSVLCLWASGGKTVGVERTSWLHTEDVLSVGGGAIYSCSRRKEVGGREARNAFTNRREVRDQEHVCPAEVTRPVVQLES